MIVASDSESDLPIFPLLHPASMHDSHGFLHSFFKTKCFLPDFHVEKVLLDAAHVKHHAQIPNTEEPFFS